MVQNSHTTDLACPASSSFTSSGLLDRLKAHDVEAWRQFAKLYGPLVYFWCRRYDLQPEDAADVFQEVFTAVSAGITRFEHDKARGRFRGWLWTITRNKIQDHYRGLAGREQATGGTEAFHRIGAIPEQLAQEPIETEEGSQLTSLLHRALESVRAEFEEKTWEAFWRVTVDQRQTREVAAEMGMLPNAVRQAKSRVLRRVRVVLGDFFFD